MTRALKTLFAGLASSLLLTTPLQAAPQVYADPAGTCNGLTPCFTTISDAVANAGPAPATVGLFPGTYAENVDLSTMGQAIAGSPGTLSLGALDAAGNPATSGVTIAPASGLALTTGMGPPLTGDLTLRGLAVTATDSTALGVIIEGNLVIEDLLAENSPQLGAVAIADGNLTVERATLQGNGAAGMIAAVSGQATLRDVIADQNGGTGLAAQAELDLLLERIDTTANGDGLEAASCNALTLIDVTIDGSTLTGGTLEAGTPSCEFSGTTRLAALQDFVLPDPSPRGAGAPSITINTLITQNNGDYGLASFNPGGPTIVDGAFAYDNVSIGLGLQADSILLDDVESLRNRAGVLAQAETVSALRVIASDSLPMPANPPLDGSGLIVIAESASLNDIQADGNPEIGLLIGQAAPGAPVQVDLIDSQFAGNRIGIAATADVPMSFTADTLFIDNQTTAGAILSNLGNGNFARIEANGNAAGLFLTVAGNARVERSLFNNNGTGIGLALEPAARASVACSDFTGNTTGMELAQGDSAVAIANYWGSPDGPTHPGNPAGSGDPVVDGANGGVGTLTYTPFLAAPATDADCPAGTQASVPVTSLDSLGRLILIVLVFVTVLRAGFGARPD